jgi:hypothetical protein
MDGKKNSLTRKLVATGGVVVGVLQYSAPVALVSLHILNPLFPYVCPTMLPVQPSTSVFVFITKIDIYI